MNDNEAKGIMMLASLTTFFVAMVYVCSIVELV